MSLDFCCDIQMVGSEFGIKNMRVWIHPAMSQQFRLVVVVCCNGVGDIFLAHFGPLVPIEHHLNTTAYLSIVADHVHPFITTVNLSSGGYFQQDNAPCHKAQIISDWFLEHDNEFTLLKWPPQSPDLSRQICSNGVMLSCQYGPKSLRNVSNTLLNLCHEELRQFWRQKGIQPDASKVYLIKWPVSVCIHLFCTLPLTEIRSFPGMLLLVLLWIRWKV